MGSDVGDVAGITGLGPRAGATADSRARSSGRIGALIASRARPWTSRRDIPKAGARTGGSYGAGVVVCVDSRQGDADIGNAWVRARVNPEASTVACVNVRARARAKV